jgi:hypothetical protein
MTVVYGIETSHRVVLEGFQDAMVGYELHLNKVQFKLLGAIKSIGHDYINVAGNVNIGKIKTISEDMELIGSIGLESHYAQKIASTYAESKSISFIPNVTISLLKVFSRKFIIGGAVSLGIWNCQKYSTGSYDLGWRPTRNFNVSPYFIVGYKFR